MTEQKSQLCVCAGVSEREFWSWNHLKCQGDITDKLSMQQFFSKISSTYEYTVCTVCIHTFCAKSNADGTYSKYKY